MDARPTKFATSRGGEEVERRRDVGFDVWGSIQTSNKYEDSDASVPYIHPLVRRSKNSMSQRSLEVCTESLGSETGSDGCCSDLEDCFSFSASSAQSDESERNVEVEEKGGGYDCNNGMFDRKELAAVNYHCSTGRRSSPRSFPPPLPSISRRDGPCVQMRRHRQDGRLVLEAVPAPSQNYLHWRREGGRLILAFIETTFEEIYPRDMKTSSSEMEDARRQAACERGEEDEAHEDEEEEERKEQEEVEAEEEGEEVEVLDRGNVVEVKLTSLQPLPHSSKLWGHRPSLVINKFVGSAPLFRNSWIGNEYDGVDDERKPDMAMVAGTFDHDGLGQQGSMQPNQEHKLLLSFKKLINRQALLHQVRRCTYQHSPLFIWEPCCVASS